MPDLGQIDRTDYVSLIGIDPITGLSTYGAIVSSTGHLTVDLADSAGSAITLGQTTMSTSLPVTIASNQSALAVTGTFWQATQPVSGTVAATQSGTWTVQQGTPPWTIQGDSASGASKAGNPVQVGGVFNTTQPTVTTGQTVEAQSTARGALIVSTGVDSFNINNISGTISLPTGAATSALQTTGNTSLATIATAVTLAAGSTTSGQTGNMTMGAVTTSAPSYTTGQSNYFSLTTAGALRTDSSATTQPISGTVTANQGTANATPWNENVAQFGGSAVVTGTGTSGAGIPRVTVSSDSNILATQSGTWTVQPGNTANTTAWFVKDNSLGTVAAGTAGTQSSLAGGVFNTSLPTLTTGQQAALQLDSSGRLIVSPTTQGILAEDHNYGTVGANTLRTASQIGNATGAATFGAGATSAQTLRTASNLYDGSGNAISSASNGYAGQQLLSVQVPNTTIAPVALGALSASISIAMTGLQTVGFQMAAGTFIGTITPQCSVDGGVSWVTCNFLNPTTGNITNSYSFSSANVLTILGIVPVGGSTNVQVIVTSYTSGTASCILSASETLSSTSQAGSLQGNGTIAAVNQQVVATTGGYGSVFINVTGTWVGTLTFQAQNGDGNWSTVYVYLGTTGSYTTSTTTVNTTAQLNCAGYAQVRVIATAWTSGTATVSWNSAAYPHQLQIYNPSGAANVLVTAYNTDGNGNALGSPLYTAGTSLYTIKPDSSITGTLTALNTLVNLPINDVSSAYARISGTWVGTIQFQGSVDGVTFVPLTAVQGGQTNAYTAAGFTTNGGVRIALSAGFTSIQAVMTAYTSGTATVVINTSAAVANVEAVQLNPANLNTLGYGAVTTAVPTYSTATNQPLSLNTSGGLRVSGVTGIIDALTTQNVTTPASAIAVLGQFNTTPTTISSGNSSPLQLDNAANLLTNVKVIATNSDKNITGTITALNGTVVIAANGTSSVNASISGTWVATLVMEGQSGDGIWYTLAVGNPNGGLNISSFTTNNLYTVGSGGFTQVRIRASTYTSGTVNVTMDASSGSAQTLAVDANGNQQIVGNVASGTADSGNGVKTSAVYNSTLPTFTNGQRADNQSDANGAQFVSTKVPRTYSAPTTALVNTTSTLILAANANRKGLYLSNTTATQQISLGFNGNAAAYQNGLTLFPGEKFWMDEYSFSTGAVYAITSGSTTYIGIQEIT